MVKSKILQYSATYVVLGFLPLASGFFLAPIYTEYLTPEEYGLIAISNIFQAYLTIAVTLGVDGALSRYYFKFYKKKLLVQSFFSTILLTCLLLSLTFYIFLYFFGEHLLAALFTNTIFTYDEYGIYTFFTTVFYIQQSLFIIYYRNAERVKIYSFLSIIFFVFITTGAFIGVVILDLGAVGSIAGKMYGALGTVIIYFILFFKEFKLSFDFRFLKSAYQYALPLVPYLFLGITLDNLDKFFVERFINLESLGKYNFAFLISSVIAVLIASIYSAISPRIYKLLEKKPEIKSSLEIKRMLSLFHFSILCIVALGTAFIVPALKIFINERYFEIVNYIPVLFAVYIPRVYFYIYSIPLFFNYKTTVLPLINLLALLIGTVAYLILVQYLGVLGVCISLFTIKGLQVLAAYIYCKRKSLYNPTQYDLNVNNWVSGLYLTVLVIIMGLNYIFGNQPMVTFLFYCVPGLITVPVILYKLMPYLPSVLSRISIK